MKNVGVNMTCITISQEQHDFAARVSSAKASATRLNCGCRTIAIPKQGRYDRVASIEMIEAVGEKYWDTYLAKSPRCSSPAVLQRSKRLRCPRYSSKTTSRKVDFISRYIFPGGRLLSHSRMKECTERVRHAVRAQRRICQELRQDPAAVERQVPSRWTNIRDMGFDERFKRMWEYYSDPLFGRFRLSSKSGSTQSAAEAAETMIRPRFPVPLDV